MPGAGQYRRKVDLDFKVKIATISVVIRTILTISFQIKGLERFLDKYSAELDLYVEASYFIINNTSHTIFLNRKLTPVFSRVLQPEDRTLYCIVLYCIY